MCFLCDQKTALATIDHLVIRSNAFPIEKNHFLLSPTHHCKTITKADIDAMVKFISLCKWPTIGWMNGKGSGMSFPDHQHYQACIAVPLLADALIWNSTRSHLKSNQNVTHIAEVGNYPVLGFSIRGTGLADTVLQMVALPGLQAFNLVFINDEVLFFPRSKESPSQSQFANRRFAGLEMAGCIVMEDVGVDIDLISGEDCWNTLSACGVSKEQFRTLKQQFFNFY